MSRSSEDDLIARYFAPVAGPQGLGLKDDAALFTPTAGWELVLTTDALVGGVHFYPSDPPGLIARKALGVNLSDLAAKGAKPCGFLLSLALPDDWTDAWLSGFSEGLGEAAREWDCPLFGGDTVRAAGPTCLSVTALGEVPAGGMVLRSGACVGDAICVSGTIGDATLGLTLLKQPDDELKQALSASETAHLIARYHQPSPRLALAQALRECAHAAMDISDGLAGDLAKMMQASKASAVIAVDRIPLSAPASTAVRSDSSWLDRLIVGGDDYEVLCAVPASRLSHFEKAAKAVDIPVTAIGEVVAGEGLPIFSHRGRKQRFPKGSFSHF